jgi:hypothetical protein
MTGTKTKITQKTNHYFVALAALAMMAIVAAMLLAAKPSYAASTTFTVDSTVDASDAIQADNICDADLSSARVCTLRAAIEEANTNNNPMEVDRIKFNIPGTGVHTISPNSPLPDITEPVIINGYTQPGSSVNTLARGTNAKLMIELNGTKVVSNSGLATITSGVVVRGLVINRFGGEAITMDEATNTRVEGNFIGTDPSGTIAKGNVGNGIALFFSANNSVGGSSPAARNLISGNKVDGVSIDPASDNNKVLNNLIGTKKDGIKPLGNGREGVSVVGDAFNTANGNSILSNSIFSNGGLGIDLNDDGPTANDAGDTDTGPNGLQNKPDLLSAKAVSGKTTIKGTLSSNTGQTYTIEFYSNPSETDEGKKFLGQTSVTTDGSGNASFTFSPTSKVAAGQAITATATNESTGDTSEFSAPRKVVA